MTRITILGGTGYAGGHIVQVAASRGHEVVAYSRHLPDSPVPGVEYRTGDVLDDAVLAAAVDGAQAVVSALSPRGELAGAGVLRGALASLAGLAAATGARFGVVGGAGSLLVAEGGPKLIDTDGFPDEFKAEARELDDALEDLRADQGTLDWFFVSPAAGFGGFAPGETLGTYRLGSDVLLADETGQSFISGADFALAVVDEIAAPAHHRTRFTVAY
nr:NAD(P)H-binding protein [Microbacterium bovistercoris]